MIKKLSRCGKKSTGLQHYHISAEIFVMLDASLMFLVYCSNVTFQTRLPWILCALNIQIITGIGSIIIIWSIKCHFGCHFEF